MVRQRGDGMTSSADSMEVPGCSASVRLKSAVKVEFKTGAAM